MLNLMHSVDGITAMYVHSIPRFAQSPQKTITKTTDSQAEKSLFKFLSRKASNDKTGALWINYLCPRILLSINTAELSLCLDCCYHSSLLEGQKHHPLPNFLNDTMSKDTSSREPLESLFSSPRLDNNTYRISLLHPHKSTTTQPPCGLSP